MYITCQEVEKVPSESARLRKVLRVFVCASLNFNFSSISLGKKKKKKKCQHYEINRERGVGWGGGVGGPTGAVKRLHTERAKSALLSG